jgi:hypothetical protein
METLLRLCIVALVVLLLYALTRSDLVGTRSDIAGAAGIMWYPKPHYPSGAPV